MVDVSDEEVREVYGTLTDDDGAANAREARNGIRHMVSLSVQKVADGLIDPKLVLAWLMNAVGAPAVLVSLLVPIREAGALLPQILLAGVVQAREHRKWVWVAGCAVQGFAALGIAAAAALLEGWAAGLAICVSLTVLALARAACSVSYKDILGKTVAKTRRGAVKGVAGSAASAAVLVFALLLISGLLQDREPLIAAICLAAGLWLAAAAVFATLEEGRSEPQARAAVDLSPLREDPQFRRFIAARGALTATALAPPYLVILSGGDGALQRLGALILASAAAAFVSSYVWGRLSDRSSRTVLILSGLAGAVSMAAAALAGAAGWTEGMIVAPLVLFVMQIAYRGVRESRSTYLVDMAPKESRSNYTAIANTSIGLLLLAAGAFGGALSTGGAIWALCGFAALSAIGALIAFGLDEVETTAGQDD
ncbi:Major Facilitator Superfamily protein [Roseivivax jejudonensis]|uniref:Major Facilitator Superfamily protein n=1 Tax=Roseivivax jejudonensis TaxID=1529041 RepID=A0A1X6ZJ23_9RHOB|nr:MFS transporter [Roseivivax jejudonensis]SLN50954.1 Major Facilitator Superfamily protein [Roseivivax jejudonensis]